MKRTFFLTLDLWIFVGALLGLFAAIAAKDLSQTRFAALPLPPKPYWTLSAASPGFVEYTNQTGRGVLTILETATNVSVGIGIRYKW